MLTLSAVVTPIRLRAQAVMTVIGATGPRDGPYSEETGISVEWIDFIVKNTGTQGAYALYSGDCGPFVYGETGRVYPNGLRSTGWLAPGQTGTLSVGFILDDYSPSHGIISVTVTASPDGVTWGSAPWDVGRVNYNYYPAGATFLAPPIAEYQPVVTPKTTSETVPFVATLTRSFTVQNAGSRPATYALAASCGAMPGCTPSKTSTTLAPGASDAVSVTFTTPGAINASNIVALSATYTAPNGQAIADVGTRPIVTPALRPSVTPKNGTAVMTQNGSGTATFIVSNTGGALSEDFGFTEMCEGWALNCTITDVHQLPDPAYAYAVTMSFQSPAVQGGPTYPTAVVRLVARLGVAADTGWLPVMLGYATVSVAPRSTTVSDPANSLHTAGITLTNSGNVAASYSVALSCTFSCYLASTSGLSGAFYLQPGASTWVGASYVSPGVGQTGTMRFVVTTAVAQADTAWVTSNASDVYAPSITLGGGAPSEGATLTGAVFAIAIAACDVDGQLGAPIVTLNGIALSTTVTSSSSSGCNTAKAGTYSILAQPGANTFAVSVSDGVHTTTAVRHFTYNEMYEATPVVTAKVAIDVARGGQQWADTFFVQNRGPITIPYTLTAGCTPALTACTPSQSTVTIGPGQTAKVWITYTAAPGPVGNVWPIVSYTAANGSLVRVNDVWTLVRVDQLAPTAVITGPTPGSEIDAFPSISVRWCDADGSLATHVVTIDGVPLADTFVSQVLSECFTAGVSSWANVPVGAGAHTIVATATDGFGHLVTSSLSFTFWLQSITDYQPVVTPKTTSETVPFAATLTRSFTVQNAGSRTATFALAASCGAMASCTPSKTTTTLASGAVDVVTVTFVTPNTTSASNTVTLRATYTWTNGQTISDAGVRPIATPALRPSVTPKNGTAVLTANGVGTATFTVGNNGALSGNLTYVPICEGWAINCTVTDVQELPDPAFANRVTVSFQSVAAVGSATYPTATVRLIAQLGVAADTGWIPTVLGYSTPHVTPRTTTVTDGANTPRTGAITVTNTGNAAASYRVDLSCSVPSCGLGGGMTGLSGSFLLQPGASTGVGATYTAPPIGQTGTVRFAVTRQGFPSAIVEADTAWITSTGAEVYAPVITFGAGPSEGSTIIGGVQSFAVTMCDADGQLAAPIVTLNGATVSTIVSSSSYTGCTSAKSGTYAIIARAGANTFAVSVSDGYHTTNVARHFTYDEAYEARPVVTAKVATELLRGGQQWADTFFVRNPGPITIPYALTAGCTEQFLVCMASQPTVSVGPSQTAKVWITYTVATSASAGYVWPIVTYTSTSGAIVRVNDVSTFVHADQLAPTATISGPTPGSSIDVFPTIGVQWCDADGSLVTHAVTIDGVPLTDTFASQTTSGCATAGASSWSNIPITLGAHTIAATATDVVGHVTTSTLAFTFALPPVTDYQPRVTPRNATVFLLPDEQTLTFAVRNAGTRTAQYQLTPSCAPVAIVGTCWVLTPTLTLAPGATDSARVRFSILGLPSVPGTPALIATYQDLAGRTNADTGRVSGLVPTIAQLYQPLVGNAGSYVLKPSDTAMVIVAFAFPVTNTGAAPVTYHVDIAGAYGFVPWARPDTSVTVNPGATVYPLVQPAVVGTRVVADIAYTASYTSPTNVTVSSTGHGYIVPGIATYGLEITPKNQSRIVGLQPVDFIVRSTGNTLFPVQGTVTCTGYIKVCLGPGNSSSVGFSLSTTPTVITVAYSADSTQGATGTITLRLQGQGVLSAYADAATYAIVSSSPYVAVTVSPDSIQLPVPTGVDIIQHFDITSTGTLASQFDYTVTCTGTASCLPIATQTTVLSPLQTQTVTVTYHTGATLGAVGTVRLIASSSSVNYARDTGVVVIRTDQMAPIAIHTVEVNPGPNVTRGQCIAIAAGDDAAYECGDLRIAHALPATTTMNKSRAPVLVYNSAHAAARGIVSANVVAAPGFYPTSLHAALQFVASGKIVDRDIPWVPEYGDGHQRRIAVQFDARALGLTTPDQPVGAFAYKLVVCSNDTNYPAPCGSDTGTVVVIDRTSSIFGKGWWLDGLEQLSVVTPASNQLLWVGGDGTTRLYTRQQTSSLWLVTPNLDRVDSLTLAGSIYTRHLPNGAHTEFNTAGRHTATVNTQGHRTKFVWSTALDKLNTIKLPVPTAASDPRTYQFAYFSPAGSLPWRLKTVTAPSDAVVRRTTLTYVNPSSMVVSTIDDPDHNAVSFGYDGLGRVASRTDRRQKTTTYFYDEANGLQRSVVATAPENIVRTFCAAETAGLTTCAPAGLDTTKVMTSFDGPRTDVPDITWFRVTPFGAPSLIIDANNDTTRTERGDAHWPLLVTRVVDVRGRAVAATYDPKRGLVTTMTDLNGTSSAASALAPATTTYTWDTTWDRVARVVSPTGIVTRATYAVNTGDRTAQYAGDDNSRFVQFGYDPSTRLVTTVTTPLSSAPTRYDYDALGNLHRATTPIGFASTIDRDFLGRDSLTTTPIDSSQTQFRVRMLSYDIMDRVLASTDTVPAVVTQGSLPQGLHVVNVYDAEGNPTSVSRWSVPDAAHTDTLTTDYTYDAAGRKLTERDRYAPASQTATWQYDPASNVRQLDPRGFQSITMQYDALNRLKQRNVPAAPNVYGAVADVAAFTYDAAGNTLTATNSWSQVIRSYDLAGRVLGDTMLIKAADVTTPGMRHSYGLVNNYDAEGRRIAQQQPMGLAPVGTGQVAYEYDPATGQLQTVTDPQRNSFTYSYNAAGLLRQLVMPGTASETHEYDADGREKHRSEVSLGVTLHDDRFGRDARGNILSLAGQSSVASPSESGSFVYGGLGAVLSSLLSVNDVESLHMIVDGFGNTVQKRQDGNELSPGNKVYAHTYEAHSNRLATVSGQIFHGTDALTHSYDASGNLSQQNYRQVTPAVLGESAPHIEASWSRVMTYDALGRLMVAQLSTVNDNTTWQNQPSLVRTDAAVGLGYGSYEEYRYDAFGRRVWKRTHRTPYCPPEAQLGFPAECTSAVVVTVWDGDQVLYELRAAGGDNLTANTLEAGIDVPSGSSGLIGQFGAIMYVHGAGIDRPLELIRNDRPMVLHASWRGMVDLSTNVAGQITTCGYTGAVLGCDNVTWPGQESGLQFNRPRPVEVSRPWYGDMVQGHADASGLQYKRNRYYDPSTGRFTQEDPIGLAGGINLYGFAAGDQVNFSDPFGLCPSCRSSTYGLFSGVWDLALQRAKDIGNALVDFTPLGDASRSADAFASGDYAAAAAYGVMAGIGVVPGGEELGAGFRSFTAFKRAAGAAGDGMQWHHVVGQTSANIERFGAEAIHSKSNLITIDKATHAKISGFYSSKAPVAGSQTVRNWLAGQSFNAQRDFGLQVLRSFGVIK